MWMSVSSGRAEVNNKAISRVPGIVSSDLRGFISDNYDGGPGAAARVPDPTAAPTTLPSLVGSGLQTNVQDIQKEAALERPPINPPGISDPVTVTALLFVSFSAIIPMLY